jgi:hypothetical protein
MSLYIEINREVELLALEAEEEPEHDEEEARYQRAFPYGCEDYTD